MSDLSNMEHLNGLFVFEGLVSQTPNFIEDTPIAPHIAGSGELLVVDSLGGCPLDWNEATTGRVVIILVQISGHAEVCNLKIHDPK